MSIPKVNWMKFIKYCVLLNLSGTFVSFFINLSRYGWENFTFRQFVASFLFSNCIGIPVWLIILRLSPGWCTDSLLRSLAKLSVLVFGVAIAGQMIGDSLIRFLFAEFSDYRIFPPWQEFLFSLTLTFAFGFGVFAFELSQAKLRQKVLDEEKAKTLAAEAQLASLESRIHPHFLFNTINSISALISENPILAEEMMENFSDLLRYSLDSNAKSLVTLKQELEITQKYLEIEKIRYEERLDFVIKCERQFYSTKIPPLSLQTLVENSIKHVVSKSSAPTTITVLVELNDGFVEVKVIDSGQGFSELDVLPNHGLDNLQKRLQNLFGERAILQFARNGTVKLMVPA